MGVCGMQRSGAQSNVIWVNGGPLHMSVGSKASPDHHIRAAQTHQSFVIVAYRDAASPDSKNSAEKYKAGDKFITRCVLEARQNRKHRPAFGCVAS
jgi:hypothetical protein